VTRTRRGCRLHLGTERSPSRLGGELDPRLLGSSRPIGPQIEKQSDNAVASLPKGIPDGAGQEPDMTIAEAANNEACGSSGQGYVSQGDGDTSSKGLDRCEGDLGCRNQRTERDRRRSTLDACKERVQFLVKAFILATSLMNDPLVS